MGWDKAKESDAVRDGNWHIARETLESASIWDSIKARKTEIADNSNSVE